MQIDSDPVKYFFLKLHTYFMSVFMALVFVVGVLSSATIAQANDEANNQVKDDASSTSHRDLASNECLQKLNNSDLVIASIAFIDGLDSSNQFKELVKRKPWGEGTPQTADEIKEQLDTQSSFLIITLTKEQVLTLDDHRDIIRWVLVASPSKTCE